MFHQFQRAFDLKLMYSPSTMKDMASGEAGLTDQEKVIGSNKLPRPTQGIDQACNPSLKQCFNRVTTAGGSGKPIKPKGGSRVDIHRTEEGCGEIL